MKALPLFWSFQAPPEAQMQLTLASLLEAALGGMAAASSGDTLDADAYLAWLYEQAADGETILNDIVDETLKVVNGSKFERLAGKEGMKKWRSSVRVIEGNHA